MPKNDKRIYDVIGSVLAFQARRMGSRPIRCSSRQVLEKAE